ncbi:MAG: UDP-3-O-acylglucosamine N-acyltransferase [bacterium]|nr:MAG: UDP-3-O-acylglucosamine N-acyltransferase [bacterium]
MILSELAKAVGGVLRGDGNLEIDRCASVRNAGTGAITYVDSKSRVPDLDACSASAVITGDGIKTNLSAIEADIPALAFAMALEILHPAGGKADGIHQTAVIDPSSKLGGECSIGPYVTIGGGCEIGDRVTIRASAVIGEGCRIGGGSVIFPRVVIYDGSIIGRNVILHAGAVIGADGFRFVEHGNERKKMPHIGIVRIGDDVEIGANSCVDRAVLDETVIGDGVKIDNLVQVGHNTVIGENSVIAGSCGISGSCRIGRNVVMGGQVGIADHIEIADGVVLAAKTGVTASIKKPGVYGGSFAQPIAEWRKSHVAYRKGSETLRRLSRLEQKGEKVEK